MVQLDSTGTDEIWPGFVRRKTPAIRLVLIDDHLLVRDGICALLGLEPDMTIVGDAANIDAGIELVRATTPDLVICDLTMPGYSGGMAVRKLCRECPTVRVLVLTGHDSLEWMRESFAAGAFGYVRKDAVRADLLAAVRGAASGAFVVCRGVIDAVMRNWLVETAGPPCPEPATPLAAEDRQILRLIALGVPTWRIAADLRRRVKAVEKRRATLMRRLDLANAAAIARFAVRCNLLSSEEVNKLGPAELR